MSIFCNVWIIAVWLFVRYKCSASLNKWWNISVCAVESDVTEMMRMAFLAGNSPGLTWDTISFKELHSCSAQSVAVKTHFVFVTVYALGPILHLVASFKGLTTKKGHLEFFYKCVHKSKRVWLGLNSNVFYLLQKKKVFHPMCWCLFVRF